MQNLAKALLALTLLFTLAACGGEDADTTEEPAVEESINGAEVEATEETDATEEDGDTTEDDAEDTDDDAEDTDGDAEDTEDDDTEDDEETESDS